MLNLFKRSKDIDQYISENLVLFVGAGASISSPSNLPSFQQLRNELLEELFRNFDGLEDCKAFLKGVPTKPELLLQVIWEYMKLNVNPIQGFQYAPFNINHFLIAKLCEKGVRIIITTNFDHCIEKALDFIQIPYQVIPHSPSTREDLDLFISSLEKSSGVLIWKPHGDAALPESLCYTIKKVARLSHSQYLKQAYEYLLSRYHFFTLGYSGYDDDLFPILYEYPMKSKTKNIIFWNSYQAVEENTPPSNLKKIWKDNLCIITGDMKSVLTGLAPLNDVSVKEWNGGNSDTYDWKNYLREEMADIEDDFKLTISGKYAFSLMWDKIAAKIWKYALALPDVSFHNSLRFRLNTTEDKTEVESIFNQANIHQYHDVAYVALYRSIMYDILERDYNTAYLKIKRYKALVQCYPEFYSLIDYYKLVMQYLETKYRENDKRINKLSGKLIYKRIELCEKEGDVLNLISTLTSLMGQLAQANHVSEVELEYILKHVAVLESYNIPTDLAGFYFAVASFIHRLENNQLFVEFMNKCEQKLHVCYESGLYDPDKYHELLSFILHQKSFSVSPKEGIELCLDALNSIEKIKFFSKIANGKEYYLGVYNSTLGHKYLQLRKYNEAETYLITALTNHQIAQDIRGEGRTLHFLGKVYYYTGRVKEAKTTFRTALDKINRVGDNPQMIIDTLKELKVTI